MPGTGRTIAIVGAGAVAQTVGRLLCDAGQQVVALASRDRLRTGRAAAFVGSAVRAVPLTEVPGLADHVLLAVSDEAVATVAKALASAGMQSGVALHTCGARGPSALAPLQAVGVACGLLHPLQTITLPEQGVKSLHGVSFAVAGDPPATAWANDIVALFEGRPLGIEADRLSYYHAGAVMASNALVSVLDAALVLLEHAGVDRDTALSALAPLARTSLDNIIARGPKVALTGPVVRGDAATVAEHLSAMRDVDPTVATLYEAVAGHLLILAKQRGLDDAHANAIEQLLTRGV